MNILTIGLDRELLNQTSVVSERYRAYGNKADMVHAVVLARGNESCATIALSSNVYVHPTCSRTVVGLMYEAYKRGRRLLNTKGEWVISAQDPFECGCVGYLLSRATGAPLQIQEHGDFFSTKHWRSESLLNRARYVIGRFLIRKAQGVRVVSERTKRTLSKLGVSADAIVVTPVHTDVVRCINATPDPGLVNLKKGGQVLFVTLARLVPQKNLELLLGAFAKALQRGVDAQLVIVGKGPEESNLKRFVEEYRIPNVHFFEWTNTPHNMIKAADVYVLSSNYEGWARVAIEALAAGVPIVMTDVGCAGDVVRDHETGLVVSVGDKNALANALIEIAHDRQLRNKLASNGRELVQTLATLDESVELYIQSLKKCIVARQCQRKEHRKESRE